MIAMYYLKRRKAIQYSTHECTADHMDIRNRRIRYYHDGDSFVSTVVVPVPVIPSEAFETAIYHNGEWDIAYRTHIHRQALRNHRRAKQSLIESIKNGN